MGNIVRITGSYQDICYAFRDYGFLPNNLGISWGADGFDVPGKGLMNDNLAQDVDGRSPFVGSQEQYNAWRAAMAAYQPEHYSQGDMAAISVGSLFAQLVAAMNQELYQARDYTTYVPKAISASYCNNNKACGLTLGYLERDGAAQSFILVRSDDVTSDKSERQLTIDIDEDLYNRLLAFKNPDPNGADWTVHTDAYNDADVNIAAPTLETLSFAQARAKWEDEFPADVANVYQLIGENGVDVTPIADEINRETGTPHSQASKLDASFMAESDLKKMSWMFTDPIDKQKLDTIQLSLQKYFSVDLECAKGIVQLIGDGNNNIRLRLNALLIHAESDAVKELFSQKYELLLSQDFSGEKFNTTLKVIAHVEKHSQEIGARWGEGDAKTEKFNENIGEYKTKVYCVAVDYLDRPQARNAKSIFEDEVHAARKKLNTKALSHDRHPWRRRAMFVLSNVVLGIVTLGYAHLNRKIFKGGFLFYKNPESQQDFKRVHNAAVKAIEAEAASSSQASNS